MLQANFGYVIVEVVKNEDITPGGIVLPENAVKPSNKGTVVFTGGFDPDDIVEDDYTLKSGTLVFFPMYAGNKIEYDGKEYIVLKDEDILAFEVNEG